MLVLALDEFLDESPHGVGPQVLDEFLSGKTYISGEGSDWSVTTMILNLCCVHAGITISNSFTQVEGRVLPAPKLNVGNGEDFFPRNGRWSFHNKKFVEPAKIQKWAVVNFFARCDMRGLIRDPTRLAEMKGLLTEQPFDVFEESP
ncbi:protein argonaute 4B-like [Eucalyptus grandis]|uniref:protein argonaute 4B-like n=1 Tax=Eucalyptus grandis TaxID=71139 RepID=UPI00192E8920|nr:protein argonaute 4B-like [Eucalyptus grandis]